MGWCSGYMIRDRDRIYGGIVTRRLRAMGIRDKPIAPASPWQNGVAERLIGSIRRECLDHIVVFGEVHLRRILRFYARYYNAVRTHRSFDKDAPVSRPIQRTGSIKSLPILGGLHHHHARLKVFGTHSGIVGRCVVRRCVRVTRRGFWGWRYGIAWRCRCPRWHHRDAETWPIARLRRSHVLSSS